MDPTLGIVAVALAVAFLFAVIGAACGASRGRTGAGAVLGLFLGPLGWLLALFLPAPPRRHYSRRWVR